MELSGFLIFLYVFLAIIALVINIFMASKMCEIAELKGYDAREKHIFAMCFWLGFFGYLYTIALPDIKMQSLIRKGINNQENKPEIKQKTEKKIEEIKHNPNLEAICKTIPGIEL